MASKQNTKVTNNSSGRKRSAPVQCHTCKQSVDIKNTLLCTVCQNRYEFDCAGYSEKLYALMNFESKKKWKCKHCINNQRITNISEQNNVTMRKGHSSSRNIGLSQQTHNTNVKQSHLWQSSPINAHKNSQTFSTDSHILAESETSDDSLSSPLLSKSVDGTISETLTIQELKEKVSILTCELESTQNELENTILENNNMQRQINKMTSEINVLKSLCQKPLNDGKISSSIKKKKRHSMSFNSMNTTPSPNTMNSNDNIKLIHAQATITDLQQKIKNANIEINQLKKQMETLSMKLQSESAKTPNKSLSSTRNSKIDDRKIFIYGTQQCVGLAAAVSHSRIDTEYEKYKITGETKPNAPSMEITKNCINMTLMENDKLVLCLGENDYSLKIVLRQLKIILETFYKHTVIILSVDKSKNFNVNQFNNSIQSLCNRYKNCNFLNCKYDNIMEICKKINYVIDYTDYCNKYLKISELKKIIARNKSSTKLSAVEFKPKKGTIPFYFSNSYSRVTRDTEKNIRESTDIPVSTKKGTIPCYFPIIYRKKFFRD